tara:strand:- start:208 stop:1350 length:1143 start_codon:yes stop_codon:yes gene_type:complete
MALSKIDVANMLTGLVPNDNTIRRPNAQPLIMNGDMQVAQRSTSVSGVGDGDTGYHTLDRWRFSEGGDNSTVFTMSQNTDVPTGQGFANSLKMDVTTADGSPGSSDAMFLQQRFEGQDLQLLKKGTSSAEKITVSFWVKSTKTGTYILEVQDSDNTRNCSQSYTVSSADTWEKKVVVFPADTTGALDDNNENSFEVNWWLLAGTDFTSGTLATSFASRTNANRAVGQVNVGDSTSNNFYMTGCQMEIGEFSSTTLPPFQHETFEENLFRCFRYYYYLAPATGLRFIGWCQMDNDDTNHVAYIDFKTHMRVAPSALEQSGTASHYKIREASTQTCDAVPTFNNADTWYSQVSFKKSSSGFSQGEVNKVGIDGGYLAWSAEL